MTKTKANIDRDALQSRLTPEQYRVTQESGTEPAFSGEYVDCKDDGSYSCVVCGNELFRSAEKFDSGSGWPSYWLPLAEDRVRQLRCPPGTCVSRRTATQRFALLHQFSGSRFSAKRQRCRR